MQNLGQRFDRQDQHASNMTKQLADLMAMLQGKHAPQGAVRSTPY